LFNNFFAEFLEKAKKSSLPKETDEINPSIEKKHEVFH